MFASTNFEGILKSEKELQEKHIVIMLFVKPSDKDANDIIKQYNYFHYVSRQYCSIYAIGYSENPFLKDEYEDMQTIRAVNNTDWYYSDKCFVECIDSLQDRLKWTYCGEPQAVILQTDPDSKNYLNFQNYVSINILYGIRQGYIESFPALMTQIVNAAKSEVTAKAVINEMQEKILSVKNVMETTLDLVKVVPEPVKKIILDRTFYKTCNSKIL